MLEDLKQSTHALRRSQAFEPLFNVKVSNVVPSTLHIFLGVVPDTIHQLKVDGSVIDPKLIDDVFAQHGFEAAAWHQTFTGIPLFTNILNKHKLCNFRQSNPQTNL